ncbi:Armadillo repeat-containing protein 7 [Datura stramonium]|uniref:Armadillo repeat-containing protein 7 n=1 Tax=Datura stramonium TaxID=4076 RepID=A0ABS8RLA2_DATST|nr:Armadillo repeat-containing protein 7 [Datura stramonium]
MGGRVTDLAGSHGGVAVGAELHCYCILDLPSIVAFTCSPIVKGKKNALESMNLRVEYLQELVTQFQNVPSEETKEKIALIWANFAYDPYNFTFLRQLNVIELFLDCISEPNEKLVEFGIGGICNACADPANVALVTQNDGILSSSSVCLLC